MRLSTLSLAFAATILAPLPAHAQDPRGLQLADLPALRTFGEVELSRDGARLAYGIVRNDVGAAPTTEIWIRDLRSGATTRLNPAGSASNPRWSPDGTRIAFIGRVGDSSGVAVAAADGTGARFLAATSGSNSILPRTGERLVWSPDGKQLAYVSTAPGLEPDANGDPMVITRYAYKPTSSAGAARFVDNRRTHVFVVDVATRKARQLTTGTRDEHSIDWSPDGKEIVYAANPHANPDRVFHQDLFVINVATGATRTLAHMNAVATVPRWSPDGTQVAFLGTVRPFQSSETNMENAHVWVVNADGSNRRDIGNAVDNPQGAPRWAADGKALYSAVSERGRATLYRFPVEGGAPSVVIGGRRVGAWSLDSRGQVAFGYSTPTEPGTLALASGSAPPTTLLALNTDKLSGRAIAGVEAFTFKAKDGLEVEAYLTLPLGRTATSRHPLIVNIHGGPHGAQGPDFNNKAQVYAARGYASLMVNYRGSSSYGQKFADAIFGDQNGKEAEDVLAGVDAALAKYSWLDASRLGVEGGSYGGQLTNWLITRTDRFKAAVPSASIANLVSFNYMSYYHDYLAVEFGRYPHEEGLMDTLWARSPLRYVSRVKTPTMFIHGDNDNNVPIAEAEQFYIALHDVGVPTVMVRYPREGHGLRETKHVADAMERSIAWYERWFTAAKVQP
ncbi:MAG: S9 family peptidase [Gemmatimonadetes bacterium]|nr:S9 family peptidase [Gemmatimonadota bacterium]